MLNRIQLIGKNPPLPDHCLQEEDQNHLEDQTHLPAFLKAPSLPIFDESQGEETPPVQKEENSFDSSQKRDVSKQNEDLNKAIDKAISAFVTFLSTHLQGAERND